MNIEKIITEEVEKHRPEFVSEYKEWAVTVKKNLEKKYISGELYEKIRLLEKEEKTVWLNTPKSERKINWWERPYWVGIDTNNWRNIRNLLANSNAIESEFVSEILESEAQKYATGLISAWIEKIIEKIGNCDSIEVPVYTSGSYLVKAVKEGHKVQLWQSRILKHSSQGTPFNQFPARLRVDGKAMSKSEFDAFFAGVQGVEVEDKRTPATKAGLFKYDLYQRTLESGKILYAGITAAGKNIRYKTSTSRNSVWNMSVGQSTSVEEFLNAGWQIVK
jgi:hypothetical protein